MWYEIIGYDENGFYITYKYCNDVSVEIWLNRDDFPHLYCVSEMGVKCDEK